MCYWDIIQRSCQDHPKVTQGQNGKNNINIHFFAFLRYFRSVDIYMPIMGLTHFQSIIIFFRADY